MQARISIDSDHGITDAALALRGARRVRRAVVTCVRTTAKDKTRSLDEAAATQKRAATLGLESAGASSSVKTRRFEQFMSFSPAEQVPEHVVAER